MAVIRFNPDDVFGTDSSEYEILTNAVPKIKGIEGAVIELGTRRGGSAKMIIDALTNNGDTNRSMFCIDPYGNIDFECTNFNLTVAHTGNIQVNGDPNSKAQSTAIKYDYNNSMRNRIIPSLYYCAYDSGLNFNFFCLEDTEFFNRYSDGVPVYDEGKKIENKYAFWFLDGPHTNDIVLRETKFFAERSPVGAVSVMDDIWMYEHDEIIESYMFENGWEILEKGSVKVSYVKQK